MRDSDHPPDGPVMVTWKTMPIVIAFVVTLAVVCVGTPWWKALVARLYVGACLAVLAFFFIRFFIVLGKGGPINRHPASEIANLIAAGEHERAYAKGVALLEANPEDCVTLFNCTAAMYFSGRTDEARRTFAQIRRDDLPRFLRPGYDDWREKLSA